VKWESKYEMESELAEILQTYFMDKIHMDNLQIQMDILKAEHEKRVNKYKNILENKNDKQK
jgi:hypothetical protein